jgi:hypothetical protein
LTVLLLFAQCKMHYWWLVTWLDLSSWIPLVSSPIPKWQNGMEYSRKAWAPLPQQLTVQRNYRRLEDTSLELGEIESQVKWLITNTFLIVQRATDSTVKTGIFRKSNFSYL